MAKVTDIRNAKVRQQWKRKAHEAGWGFGYFNPEALDNDAPQIYVADVRSGMYFMTRPGRETLRNAEKDWQDGVVRLEGKPVTFEDLCFVFGNAVGDYGKKKLPNTPENQELIGAFAVMYLVNTKTYALTKPQLNNRVAFVIIVHPGTTKGQFYLRPFSLLVGENEILPPDSLSHHVNQVLVMDRAAHPERFFQGKVLTFTPRKR